MSHCAAARLMRALGVTFLVLSTAVLGCGTPERTFLDPGLDATTPGNDASTGADTTTDPSNGTEGGRQGDASDATGDISRDTPTDRSSDAVTDLSQDGPVGDGANQPPTIVGTIPADAEVSVAVATTISVDFSKPMNPATVMVGIQPLVALGSAIWNPASTSIAFTPPARLAAMTKYTVTVTGSDTGGRPLTGATTFSFTTGVAADTTAPTIRATVPVDNAVDVPSGTNIMVTFTEPMDVGSVIVTSVPDIMLGMPTFGPQNNQVSFTPTATLLPYTQYTITVAGQDPAKNPLAAPTTFKFTTATPPDTTPPTIVSVAPPNAATAVPSNSSIVITFSEPMNVAVTNALLSLSPMVTCTGGWAWNVSGTTATCVPTMPLSSSTLYTVGVAGAASDVAGNKLATAFSSTFTTGVMPDTTPPTIVSAVPMNGATGAPRGAKIVVNFSEAMDINSAQGAFSITAPPGVSGTFAWASGNTQLVFTPSALYPTGATVNWQVSTAAKDASGNAKTTLDTFSFNVIKSATVNLPCIGALDGYIWSSPSVQTGVAFIAIGDTTSSLTYRGYAAFDMTAIPATATITAASLYLEQYNVLGTPYGAGRLGDVLWRHVDYGPTLEVADYSVAPLAHTSSAGTLSVNATYEWKAATVTLSLRDDLMNRAARGNRSEFMIRFTQDTVVTTANDFAYFYSCEATAPTDRPYVSVTYDYP
ncbi:MAG TPA: Ig-like domain-containing protein [Polyangiaceae bacterium]|nr:Ig-like domain-containing protein [Polyangiaceae bacterium]